MEASRRERPLAHRRFARNIRTLRFQFIIRSRRERPVAWLSVVRRDGEANAMFGPRCRGWSRRTFNTRWADSTKTLSTNFSFFARARRRACRAGRRRPCPPRARSGAWTPNRPCCPPTSAPNRGSPRSAALPAATFRDDRRTPSGHVVDEQAAVRSSIVAPRDREVRLLARRVPDLQVRGLAARRTQV